jgi:hypothetical protein
MVGYLFSTPVVAHTISVIPTNFPLGNNGGLLEFSSYMGNMWQPSKSQVISEFLSATNDLLKVDSHLNEVLIQGTGPWQGQNVPFDGRGGGPLGGHHGRPPSGPLSGHPNGPLNCHNLNIGFMTKCEVQRPMTPKVCLGVKHALTNGGGCKGRSPMTHECTPTLGVALVRELQMFGALVGKANKHQIEPLRHH